MSIRSMTVLTLPSQREGTVQQPCADTCVLDLGKVATSVLIRPDAFTTIWIHGRQ